MKPSLSAVLASFFIVASLTNSVSAQNNINDNTILYDGCNVEDYYAGLLDTSSTTPKLRDDVTRQQLESLLESTHRKVLPYTNNDRDDVWKALIDLDPGSLTATSSEPTVRLLYRQVDTPALPHGTSTTWNREHLWPKSRGVEYTGSDFTDIHHLRPSDWNVNSARNNLYFGACGIAKEGGECESPAHVEAAEGTEADSETFLPPTVARGDVARAILYMDLRYSNQNNDGLDLVVTDCPSNQPHEMAYKSQLLEWHAADIVTDEERYRNQRACERWQGNRNVFVDFPELVERLFGLPQMLLGEGLGYPGCDAAVQNDNNNNNNNNNPISTSTPAPVSPPSSSGGASQCSDLDPADVMVVGMNSDDPERVALVTLKDLGEGLTLFMTDNAWTGSSFRTNEGTISFRVPSGGMAAGTVFEYGASSSSGSSTNEMLPYSNEWEGEGGQFQLSASGDTILVYCSSDNNDRLRFLTAVDYSGDGWMESNLEENAYGTSNSALPSELDSTQLGAVALSHFDNYYYIGLTEGTVLELRTSLSNPTAWEGSNDASNTPSVQSAFIVTPPSSPGSSPPNTPTPSPGDIMVIALNSANPDMVALVALDNLPGNFEVYLTDNAWTGNDFRTNEGTLKLVVPSSGIAAGSIFGYGEGVLYGNDWESVGGRFALAESGDTILIYTTTNGSSSKDFIFLGAFSYTGVDSWVDTGMPADSYETDSSALPNSLSSVGTTTLSHQDNYAYVGPNSGTKAFLQTSLQDVNNWQGSTDPAAAPPVPFLVKLSNPPSSSFWSFGSARRAIATTFVLTAII